MLIDRQFRDIPDDKIVDLDQAAVMSTMGWSGAVNWADLLQSERILIVAEAGAGKTHECRQQRSRLWEAGEPAFLLELSELSRNNVRDIIGPDEEERLDAWLASQSDKATFFLDSIDELKLTLGSFAQALTRLSRAIKGQLGRARIVITTRPTPVDFQTVRSILPTAQPVEESVTGDHFAAIARKQDREKSKTPSPSRWRNVVLLPLSNEQIRAVASGQGINDPDALMADINRRHAMEFARRPQDLIQICSDWRGRNRLRTHRDQVSYDVQSKLTPRTDRREKAQISPDRAIEGASRLALAALLTRKLTIRHSTEADTLPVAQAALDPMAVLPDWTPEERESLLERALFGFASYGRVRFHHRSVIEWLAASRLQTLAGRGMPVRALKRLLLAETGQGKRVVRPSLRPVAAWLSLEDQGIFEEVRDREPEVLLDFGDPESLTSLQRSQALRAYVGRYGLGGWRGMRVPWLQVQRIASADLSSDVQELWKAGVENSEVRQLLLGLIEAGRMTECADIAHDVACGPDVNDMERLLAVDSLCALSDPRIRSILDSIESDPTLWPDALTRSAIVRLFPEHLGARQLCRILARLEPVRYSAGDISWQLTRGITDADIPPNELEELRRGLTDLVASSTTWQSDWPHIVSSKSFLAPALAATCLRLLTLGVATEELAGSIAAVLQVKHTGHVFDDPCKELRATLASASAAMREAVFWVSDAIAERLHPITDAWPRLFQAAFHGPLHLEVAKDQAWVLSALADTNRPDSIRTMMLEAAFHLWDNARDYTDYLHALRPRVADRPDLEAIIDQRLKPSPVNAELKRMEKQSQERREHVRRRDAKAHASWVQFWREVSDSPDLAFSPEREDNTAWNLWRAMEQAGDESRSSGWNRRFVERSFSRDVADRLRLKLIKAWRNDRPTLRSERPDDQKDTYLLRWQFGLAAISAEAEDKAWARNLTRDEAELAARYVPIQLNGFPTWLEDLVEAHPAAVDAVLGEELSKELDEAAVVHQPLMTLQNIKHSSQPVIASFLPRLSAALVHVGPVGNQDPQAAATRLADLMELLLRHGDTTVTDQIASLAVERLDASVERPIARVWLSALIRLDPEAGVARLESILTGTHDSTPSDGLKWIASLFGDRYDRPVINLTSGAFSPALLLRLVRLAYRHVQTSDDIQHEGAYTPETRDHAERGRNAVLSALLDAKGSEGWSAKLEMAADPLFAHFRDRAIAIAEERAAEEADSVAHAESWVRSLDRYLEAGPITRDDMFALLTDRLDDVNDLLRRDASPRAALALIRDEKIMRREIARALQYSANHAYTVDQEAATADEKETDIRMRSTASDQQAIIELKIGEGGRSARDLRATLKDQLVTKYMAAEHSRSGCLLITIADSRTWQHPDTNDNLDLSGLIKMLNEEAARIVANMGYSLRLTSRGLDLRPRLETEAKVESKAKNHLNKKI